MFLAWRDLRRTWRRFVLVGLVVVLVAVLSTVLAGPGRRPRARRHLRAARAAAHPPGARARLPGGVQPLDAERARARRRGEQRAAAREVSPIGVSFVNAASTDGGPSLDLALFGVAGRQLPRRIAPRPGPRSAGRPGLVLVVRARGGRGQGRRRATASAAPT